jgi:dimethylamine monooxygenase subunit A
VIPLAELFPPEDYRFHLSLRRGDLRTFFARSAEAKRVLRERQHWLQQEPMRYAALQPEGEPLATEWTRLVQSWGVSGASVLEIGGQLEPDFLLLARDAAGDFRLRGGALVFPTSWALEEKLGHTLDWIHGVVPGLNPSLGAPIRQFLQRLKPGGAAFLRSNWGLAATDALNLHPSRPRPRLEPDVVPHRVWLRVEHQILAALETTGGIVFGIRLALHPLDTVLADPLLRPGFHRALRTMPDELAAYKGLAPARTRLLELSA